MTLSSTFSPRGGTPPTLRIATRRSALALWQANTVKSLLETRGVAVELVPVVTTGDRMQKGALADVHVSAAPENAHLTTGKGLFVKEIQECLLRGEADLAVHSMKDLPVTPTPGLRTVAVLPRAPVRDVLILSPEVRADLEKALPALAGNAALDQIPASQLARALGESVRFRSGPVGTTSARRQLYLRRMFGEPMRLEILRGNVDTRLGRVARSEFSAIMLAEAGLSRLGLYRPHDMWALPVSQCVPAPAQGIIALETREADDFVTRTVRSLSHAPTLVDAVLERTVLSLLGGDCHAAVAVHRDADELRILFSREEETVESVLPLRPEALAALAEAATRLDADYAATASWLMQSVLGATLIAHLRSAGYGALADLEQTDASISGAPGNA